MKFLMEHEMAFDTQVLGFPSIQGCHAIVFQTDNGIYGFHNYGGSGDSDFSPRAKLFKSFVNTHGGLTAKAHRVYGVSFVGNNQRGYSGKTKDKWKQELVKFATELGFAGKISGYDLYKSFNGSNDSAYVEFRVNGNKCDVYVRKWGAQETPSGSTRNPNPNDHKKRTGASGSMTLSPLINVVTGINTTGLTKISKTKLR